GLEEAALGEWLHLLKKERRLRRAPRPVVILRSAHRMACVHAGWPERAHDSANVIGMAVRQDDALNLSGRRSGRSERLDQPGGALTPTMKRVLCPRTGKSSSVRRPLVSRHRTARSGPRFSIRVRSSKEDRAR